MRSTGSVSSDRRNAIDVVQQTAAILELIQAELAQLHDRQAVAFDLGAGDGRPGEAGAGDVVRPMLHGRKQIDKGRHDRATSARAPAR